MRHLLFALLMLSLELAANEPAKNDKTIKETLSHTSRINPHLLLDVIDEQLNALRSNEIEKAYRDYSSSEFLQKTSLDDFKKQIVQFTPFSKNKLFQFQSFYTEDNIATFGGDLLSTDGDSVRVEYDLVMEGGKWKIYGIQIYQNSLSTPIKNPF